MLERKIEKEIRSWITDGDKALLVYGVRQAGKTFIIRKCLQEMQCDYVEFNLIREPEIVSILENSGSVDDLVLRLSLASEKKMTPGKTVLFFDEIQKYRDIVTKIKFLVEDGRYRYIMSGSLLGVEITSLKSAPVGYLKSVTMYPLDFEEFLQIFQVSDSVLSVLRNCYEEKKPVDTLIHKKLMEMFHLYLIIGGMPAAVEKYRNQADINAVMEEHLSIIEQYKLDFTQYEEENRRLLLTRIYEMMPAELNEKNKRFMIADMKKSLRYDRVQDSFVWLWKAGVAIPTFNVTEPTVPLMLNEKSSLFKLFLSDVGLLTTIYGRAAKLKLVNEETDINKGAIYENVIAQELNAHGYSLNYYNSKKFGELDFVIEHNGKVLPIEVKSGKDYEKHSALTQVMSVEEYHIEEAIVFMNENVMRKEGITYLPIYMIMFLEEDELEFGDISVERFMLPEG
ncbi:MAG: ATP-binding protein [Lachnospiraceae bacterium]|nr:ATP-binding protein [Lachnospiraceae bacterium]